MPAKKLTAKVRIFHWAPLYKMYQYVNPLQVNPHVEYESMKHLEHIHFTILPSLVQFSKIHKTGLFVLHIYTHCI